MEDKPVLLLLEDDSHNETSRSLFLRQHATKLIAALGEDSQKETSAPKLSATILEILTQIIKPLFSGSQHAKLSSTGRVNRVENALPAANNRFTPAVLFDDAGKPLWKNGWTASLLSYVLNSYSKLPGDIKFRKTTIEAHFHFLVPAVLHLLDDLEIAYKCAGLHCLQILCDELFEAQSGIVTKSGLMDVFVDALRSDFSMLPTLTDESDSLDLFQHLYPAWRSLVRARFAFSEAGKGLTENKAPRTTEHEGNRIEIGTWNRLNSEETKRQSYLTLLLRHQLLYSLSHLSTGTGVGSTLSVSLSTFFISQLGWIFNDMGLASVIHLQDVIPLLRNVLLDPFGASSPDMLLSALRALESIVQVDWVRIKDRWWVECLRAVSGCWLNVVDELHDLDVRQEKRVRSLKDVQEELKVVACLLQDVVGEAFSETKTQLMEEEEALRMLFGERSVPKASDSSRHI